jgi:hypothetical protein
VLIDRDLRVRVRRDFIVNALRTKRLVEGKTRGRRS